LDPRGGAVNFVAGDVPGLFLALRIVSRSGRWVQLQGLVGPAAGDLGRDVAVGDEAV